jgi:transcriptional regulator with XRE-family HTH domain
VLKMGKQAVGAYLEALRVVQGMSRAKLADQLGMSEMNISRVEKGAQDTSGLILVRWASVLQADWTRIHDLAEIDDASLDEATFSELSEQIARQIKEAPTLGSAGVANTKDPMLARFLQLLASGVNPVDAARVVLDRSPR